MTRSLPRDWWPVLAVAAAAVAVLFVSGHHLLDLTVYRFGGEAVLRDGAHLYDVREPGSGLPFTYPPISAVLMVPLALISVDASVMVWTLLCVAALGGVIALALHSTGRRVRPWTVAALTAGALALEPVWATISFGQVNLFLLLAVLTDLLLVRGRARGVLIGIAAAVKLTPLVFVAYLVLRREWRAAGTAGAAFVACHFLGWLVLPHASAAAYFGGVAFDPSRVGGVPFASNQSVLGVLTRLGGEESSTLVWFLVAGALSGATLLLAAHLSSGDELLGAGVAGLAMLLASPISWSHHWVWCVPIAFVLWDRARPAALAWLAVFASTCIFRMPTHDDRELARVWWQQVIGNAYFWAALGRHRVARRHQVAGQDPPGHVACEPRSGCRRRPARCSAAPPRRRPRGTYAPGRRP